MSDLPALALDYIQTAAIVVGGLWAYRKFLHERHDEPATDIDVDLEFVGTQAGQHIVQVTAALQNKSLVRHSYRNFSVSIRYLTSEDPLADGGPRLHYQLLCPK